MNGCFQVAHFTKEHVLVQFDGPATITSTPHYFLGQVILYKLSSETVGSSDDKSSSNVMKKWIYVGLVKAHTHDIRALTVAVPISREGLPIPYAFISYSALLLLLFLSCPFHKKKRFIFVY